MGARLLAVERLRELSSGTYQSPSQLAIEKEMTLREKDRQKNRMALEFGKNPKAKAKAARVGYVD